MIMLRVTLYVAITSLFFFMYFTFLVDKFHSRIPHTIVSLDNIDIRSGDILNVGITYDGSIASHWINNVVHHYAIVQNIEGVLHIVHTWHKNIKGYNNVHVEPSYSIQPLKDYIQYSKMTVCEIFRHPLFPQKSITLQEIKDALIEYKTSQRCYITIMNFLDDLYPEFNIYFGRGNNKYLRNYYLWVLFFYQVADFDYSLLCNGYHKYKDIVLLDNLVF